MNIKWKRMRKNIPEYIHCGNNRKFHVVFLPKEEMPKTKNNKPLYGITTFNPNIIKINKDVDDKHIVLTFWHEFLHTFCIYKQLSFTEKQVMALERRFPFFYNFFMIVFNNKDIFEGKANNEK